MRETENIKLIKDIKTLSPVEYKMTAHAEKAMKKVEETNHKIYDTVNSVNSSISEADKLINEMANKKVHEKRMSGELV